MEMFLLIAVAVCASVFSMIALRKLIPVYFEFVDNKAILVSALLTMIGAVIGAAISSEIYLGLGLLGALSIVRFRTPIRSAAEISVIFLAVTAGISSNASYIYPLTLFISAVMLGVVWRVIDKNSRIIVARFYISVATNVTDLRRLVASRNLNISVEHIASRVDPSQVGNFILSGPLEDVEVCIEHLASADLLRDSTRIS
jgi:hypothetical protein